MARRAKALIDAAQRAGEMRVALGREVRIARASGGATLAATGAAMGRSASWVSRAERGQSVRISLEDLVLLCAATGLRLWTSTYPGDRPVRDIPQLTALRRFRERIGEQWSWAFEVPVPIAGDRRAADATIRNADAGCLIEVFTKLIDAQAQLRSVLIKARDMGLPRVVVVVTDTDGNRRALAAAADVLTTTFPVGSRAALRAFRRGEVPDAHAIVVL